MKKNWKQSGLLWAIAFALLAALIFGSGVFNAQKVWPNVALDCLGDDFSASREAGDAYGALSAGPYYDLPAGKYRVKVQLEGDGENAIYLRTSNDARITPAELKTQPGVFDHDFTFELLDPAHNFSIEASFESGTWMTLHNVRLYTPMYTDDAFSAVFVLLGVMLAGWLYANGQLRGELLQRLLIVAAAVVFASQMCLRKDALLAYDSNFHMARIMNLAEGLKSGQFPVRLGTFSYNGYGAVTSVFYPDLLLYPLAGMVLGGASITYVMNMWWVALNVISAATMYVAAKRIWQDEWAAVCAAVLYVLAPYRLHDLFIRSMMGQLTAMAFFPLFALGLWEVLCGDRSRYVLLGVSAALILQSHMLSTVLCALAAAAALCVSIRQVVREKRYKEIALAVLIALLLSLYVLVPMAQMYLSGVTSTVIDFDVTSNVLGLPDLISGNGYIGFPMLLGVLMMACTGLGARKKPGTAFALAGCACIVLASSLFPWNYAVVLTRGAVKFLQFPWRFLSLTAVCFALCGGWGYAKALSKNGAAAALLALAIALIPATPIIGDSKSWETIPFGTGANPYMVYPEYQIEGTDVHATRSRQAIASPDVTVTDMSRRGSSVRMQVQAPEGGTVTLPLFGFDGYAAELGGERLALALGENNRLAISLPEGTQGEVRVWYAGKAIWRAFDGISLAALLLLAARTIQGRREKKLKAAA